MLIIKTDETAAFVVKESFGRQFGLYYIPVMPLYALWQRNERRPVARLLTAVSAYLYINAGLSYYRDEDNYMYYNYEILQEWITEEPETDDLESYQKQLAAIDNAALQGDFIHSKMLKGHKQERLRRLIRTFTVTNNYEAHSLSVAKEAMQLWLTYPDDHIYRYANHGELNDEDDDYWERSYIAMHEYIGFIGSTDDIISDSLFGMVNNDFNERSDFQEPELTTIFNEPQPAYCDKLDYEYRLFSLLDKLCTLLHQQP